MNLDNFQSRVNKPYCMAAGSKVLANFLERILSQVTRRDDFHSKSRRTVKGSCSVWARVTMAISGMRTVLVERRKSTLDMTAPRWWALMKSAIAHINRNETILSLGVLDGVRVTSPSSSSYR